jgi:hypothetical protein
MSEWWRYRPSDFLMFSARTWARLVESWNEALWPWQVALVGVGLALLIAAALAPARAKVWAMVALAAAWAWVAWAFHWERFADINTGARWFAAAFGAQAVLLLLLGLGASGGAPSRALRAGGLWVAAAALLLYPAIAPVAGWGWRQSETVGAMPDPTALFTAGLLLALPVRHRAALLALPLLALAVGWTTAWLLRAG